VTRIATDHGGTLPGIDGAARCVRLKVAGSTLEGDVLGRVQATSGVTGSRATQVYRVSLATAQVQLRKHTDVQHADD
jgi:hypothetical protein